VKRDDQGGSAQVPLIDRVRSVQEKFAAVSFPRGQPADKAFFDSLSSDP